MVIFLTVNFRQGTESASITKINFVPTPDVVKNYVDDSMKFKVSPEPSPEKFRCRSREALKIWRILRKTDYMKGFLGDKETGDCRDYLEITHRIDLNGDGQPELYVESGYKTGPVSFRTAWIFQKKKNTYQEILGLERDDNFKVMKTKTTGFHDLSFISRRDVGSAFLSTYKYKNGKYESVKCRVGVYDNGVIVKKFDCENEKGLAEFYKRQAMR